MQTRLLLIQGSPRSKNNCPDQDSKTNFILKQAVKSLPKNIDYDILDLSISDDESLIPACKGCIGTSGGYHCHWPCTCYGPGSASKNAPDIMHDRDVYKVLEESHGFIVFTPIHWYSVSSQVKNMFDRLVCASMTLTREDAEELGIGKDAKVSRQYAKDGRFDYLLKNHLEGRYAGFFVHGDDGANDYWKSSGKLKRALPMAYSNKKDQINQANKAKSAVDPIVAQCRYSGIYVPDDCIVGSHINKNLDYATANDRTKKENLMVKQAKDLILKVDSYIRS